MHVEISFLMIFVLMKIHASVVLSAHILLILSIVYMKHTKKQMIGVKKHCVSFLYIFGSFDLVISASWGLDLL